MLNLSTLSLTSYLDEAAGDAPVPGGGSVAAVAGALAVSMGSMVGAFTLSAKRYEEHHDEMNRLRARLEEQRAALQQAAQQDMEAYAGVSAAYALPRASEEEKEKRREAIVQACRDAMQPPLATARLLAQVAEQLPRLSEIGNKNLITDTGVCALLCQAAFDSALLNVRINLKALPQDPDRQTVEDEMTALQETVISGCGPALQAVYGQLAK